MLNYIEYKEGQSYSNRYFWWACREIGNQNSNIDAYAKLIKEEYEKLETGQITIEDFQQNTPEIIDETCLNYIRNKIIEYYPN
jgi:hypothetical protein